MIPLIIRIHRGATERPVQRHEDRRGIFGVVENEQHFGFAARTHRRDEVGQLLKHGAPRSGGIGEPLISDEQLLLFAGRDSLRVLLRKPRETGLRQEKELGILFQALREYYARTQPGLPLPEVASQSSVTPTDSDPENAGPVGFIDPSSLRP